MSCANGDGPLRAVLVGAGNRGREVYGAWALAHPDRMRIVAVADPDPSRRATAARDHGIPDSLVFADWRDLVSSGRAAEAGAEACLVCTQDAFHVEPALAALDAGWHVLLEKPMATSVADCARLVDAAEAAKASRGLQLRVCHVVRYTPFFQAVKRALDEGLVGQPVHIAHAENVSHWHFAHSYVRGSWSRSAESTPIVLAKTCHDLDILHWLAGRPAERVSSFGRLSWFRAENAPPGAPGRCLDGCPVEKDCPWHVDRTYGSGERLLSVAKRADSPFVRAAAGCAIAAVAALRSFSRGPGRELPFLARAGEWASWPVSVIGAAEPTARSKEAALRGGPYGRCVFRCDNDQPDHEALSIEFEGGLTATMTMEGLSNLDGRWIRIDGSRGTLEGRFTYAGERLEFWDHRTMRRRLLHRSGFTGDAHGGGDAGLVSAFASSIRGGGPEEALTSAAASLESHLLGFAAERARLGGRVVEMEETRREARASVGRNNQI